jgi:hypothetical protein
MDVATVPPSPEQIEATGMKIEAPGMICRMAGYGPRSFRLELPLGGAQSTTRATMGPASSRAARSIS